MGLIMMIIMVIFVGFSLKFWGGLVGQGFLSLLTSENHKTIGKYNKVVGTFFALTGIVYILGTQLLEYFFMS